ncbi:MAG TPA: Lrp/AsnC family transcriptional regulator [Acidimicrobiia bacterium]|nr:Lrp/AsnC family transcriptional regulator [Acidimicrobiia bacterium]
MTQTAYSLDELDTNLIRLLQREPRIGMLEASRRLGVARGTVTARMDRMRAAGVITGFGPDLDLRAIGYTVMAFSILELAQGRIRDVTTDLSVIPEVLEAHTIAGRGDLLIRIVARTNDHLMDVIESILRSPHVARAETMIALTDQIPFRPLSALDGPGLNPRDAP